MDDNDNIVKRVAKAIAEKNGDDYDKIPQNKKEWVDSQGVFQGRFRDVNEPYQVDYYDMAEGAIRAMTPPTKAMLDAVGHFDGEYHDDYQDMMRAALEEKD